MKKRVLSAISGLLILLMLAGCVSCKNLFWGNEREESDVIDSESESIRIEESDTQSDIEDESDEELETDEKGFIKDQIGEDIKYNGKEVKIIGWSGGGEIDFDVQSGSTISNAVYKRNVKVESRLGVRLRFNTSLNGGNSNRYEYISSVENMLMGTDNYDLIATYSMNASNFAMDGYLLNLADREQIQLEDYPWWSQDIVENTVINGRTYFVSGPISPKLLYETMAIFVNLDLCDEYMLEDPRYLVEDYEWTMEKMFEMAKGVGEDIEGDGKDNSDMYGIVLTRVALDGFIASNDMRYLDRGIDASTGKEIIQIGTDFNNGIKIIDLAQTLKEKTNTVDVLLTATDSTAFINGNSLFTTTQFDIARIYREKMDFNYGYLPYPMADKLQQRYYSTAGFPYSMWCIPNSTTDADCAAYVLECLASESYREIQPAVFEDIKFKYSNDIISSEMFELIIGNMTYDFGRLFHNNFDYAYSPIWTFRSAVAENKDFSTKFAESKTHIETTLIGINGLYK